jgi:hypothetical protein
MMRHARFFSIAFGLGLCISQIAVAQKWYAELYQDNPLYVEITIKAESRLDDVMCNVSFLGDGNTSLGEENFVFTDASLLHLKGGDTYRRYFRHSYSSSTIAKGLVMTFTSGGTKADDPHAGTPTVKRRKSSGKFSVDSGEIRILGAAPPSK